MTLLATPVCSVLAPRCGVQTGGVQRYGRSFWLAPGGWLPWPTNRSSPSNLVLLSQPATSARSAGRRPGLPKRVCGSAFTESRHGGPLDGLRRLLAFPAADLLLPLRELAIHCRTYSCLEPTLRHNDSLLS